jgi:hypothetical protein
MEPVIILGIVISAALFVSLIIFDLNWARKKNLAHENWEKWAEANNLKCVRAIPRVSATTWTFILYFLIYGVYKGKSVFLFSMNTDKLGRNFILSKTYLWLNGKRCKEFNSEEIDAALDGSVNLNFKEAGNYAYLKTVSELIMTMMGEIYLESGVEISFQEAFNITKAMRKYYRLDMTIFENIFGRKERIVFNDEKALEYFSAEVENEISREAILKFANKFQEILDVNKGAIKLMLN